MTFPLMDSLAKLNQVKPLASLVALFGLAVVLVIIQRRARINTRMLTYGALAIAASFVLSYLKLFSMPNGGTVTPASMLPLFVFAWMFGPAAGMAAGLAYGLLQYFQEPFFVHWAQFILDYPLPFALLGLAGLSRKNFYLGAVMGTAARFVCHFIAGVVFYAEYAGDQNVFVYSAVYNLSYLVPDLAICLVILAVPQVRRVIHHVRTQYATGAV